LRRSLVFAFDLFFGTVACLVKFVENFQVFDRLIYTVVGIRPDFLGADVFQDCFGLTWVVPEVVLMRDAFLVFDLYAFTIVVKDTSLGRRRGPLDLLVVRKS
jgi:hypothetical protein